MDGFRALIRKRSLPTGLLGLVGLLILIEGGLSRRDRFAHDQAEHWSYKRKLAAKEAPSAEILAFGDSLVEFAFLPRVIEESAASHPKAINLAVPAGTPAGTYLLLKKAIESGARPRAIVLDFMPLQLVKVPFFEGTRKRMWPEMATLAETIEVAWVRRDPDFGLSMTLGRLFKSYRARDQIRSSVLAAIDGKGTGQHDFAVFLTKWNLRSNKGSLVMPDSGRKADTSVNILDLKAENFDPVFAAYIDKSLRLAADHQIPVYCLLTPISPEHQAAYDAAGVLPGHDAYLRAKQGEFPNLIVVDGRHSGYDPSLFVDGIHLNRRGATAFSTDLAGLLDRDPGPKRWFDMPRFRERDAAPSVEDIVQSRTAIETPKALRR